MASNSELGKLTQAELKNHLSYDPDTGVFVRVSSISNRVKVGEIAGSHSEGGYAHIRVLRRRYVAHRLAWLYVYGAFPAGILDHRNGNKADNRISNLREATHSQNHFNVGAIATTKSGCPGVTWHRKTSSWTVRVRENGRSKNLGYFKDKEEAIAVRKAAARRVYGEFYREV